MGSDWISRAVIPDMYPRREDPFRPVSAMPPTMPGGQQADMGSEVGDPIDSQITQAGGRPPVYMRGMNYALSVLTAPTPLASNRSSVDGFIVDVPSTAANSVFFGFGSGLSTASGLEIIPGIPLVFQANNDREHWELQRSLEFIAAILASDRGMSNLGPYRAPRLVVDPSQYFLVAAAATTVAIMLLYTPEQQ